MEARETRPRGLKAAKIFALCTLLLLQPLCSFGGTSPMPAIHAKTLSGKTVRLPSEPDGRPVVLVFGFGRAARTEGEIWGKALIHLQQERRDFDFFQVAMLSGAPRFAQGFITRAIRASVPREYHGHMLLLTDDAEAWRNLLGVTDDGRAYVILCTPAGKVLWQARGAGRDQIEALRAELRRKAD